MLTEMRARRLLETELRRTSTLRGKASCGSSQMLVVQATTFA
jgi:hypothetical protein